ncbi:hypothetical protein M405DRAFT_804696 [Rhizopogon salebrosus TDB-379]|nr:hypothetical protein M405DRAFT_804696 [Rhizopogon salebrosus TDB-379]
MENISIFVSGLSARKQFTLPNVDQRRRVLDVLSALSLHHTTDCTRNSQRMYMQQVRDRYEAVVGHKTPSESTWFSHGSPTLIKRAQIFPRH